MVSPLVTIPNVPWLDRTPQVHSSTVIPQHDALTFPKPNIPLPHRKQVMYSGTAGGSWNYSVITAAWDTKCQLKEARKTGSILGNCIFTNLKTGMLYLAILNLGVTAWGPEEKPHDWVLELAHSIVCPLPSATLSKQPWDTFLGHGLPVEKHSVQLRPIKNKLLRP